MIIRVNGTVYKRNTLDHLIQDITQIFVVKILKSSQPSDEGRKDVFSNVQNQLQFNFWCGFSCANLFYHL